MPNETLYGFHVVVFAEAAGQPRSKRDFSDMHPEPKGCQWFRSCEECRFEDCLVDRPLDYDSEEARALRSTDMRQDEGSGLRLTAISLRTSGVPEYRVAIDMGVTPRTVRKWCKGVAAIRRNQGNRFRQRQEA